MSDFRKAHRKQYAYHHARRPVEIVNIRIKAVGKTQKVRMKKHAPAGRSPRKAYLKEQGIVHDGKRHGASVFDRARLRPGNRIRGPALVVDTESTVFLPPLFRAWVDAYLNLIIGRKR